MTWSKDCGYLWHINLLQIAISNAFSILYFPFFSPWFFWLNGEDKAMIGGME